MLVALLLASAAILVSTGVRGVLPYFAGISTGVALALQMQNLL